MGPAQPRPHHQQSTASLSHYPSLTDEEFAEACSALERRCHDTLSGTDWLGVRWHEGELEIKQMGRGAERTAAAEANVCEDAAGREGKGNNSVCCEKFVEDEIDGMIDEENADMEVVVRRDVAPAEYDRPAVDFSVTLSPTYRVPVLWFTLSSTKVARFEDLRDIYSRIVDASSHATLKGVGVMGGVSLANHPSTDRPMFFVHPCNTLEALVAVNNGSKLDALGYLLLWLGIVGSVVGLYVPISVVDGPTLSVLRSGLN